MTAEAHHMDHLSHYTAVTTLTPDYQTAPSPLHPQGVGRHYESPLTVRWTWMQHHHH